MSKKLIANPPAHEVVLENMRATHQTRKFDITAAVRDAVITHGGDAEHYAEMTRHLSGGKITGNKVADAYSLAELMVHWEAEIGNTSLQAALTRGEIQLNAIVKRLPSLFRKHLGIAIEGWVCTGVLIEKLDESGLSVVNG